MEIFKAVLKLFKKVRVYDKFLSLILKVFKFLIF